MDKSVFKTPAGLELTLRGTITKGAFIVRDSARVYLVISTRPKGLREPPRVESIRSNGDLEVALDDSLVPEVWSKQHETSKNTKLKVDFDADSYVFES